MRLRPSFCRGGCGDNFGSQSGSTATPGFRGAGLPALHQVAGPARKFSRLLRAAVAASFCWRSGPVGLIFGFALLQYGAGEHVQLSNEPITFGTADLPQRRNFLHSGLWRHHARSRRLRALWPCSKPAWASVSWAWSSDICRRSIRRFRRREIEISLLDARAGSPPTAAELLARFGSCPQQVVLDEIFRDWERWSAELLESHISYPVLSFFRSQHNNQSWLGALTMILDASALVIAGSGRHSRRAGQAHLCDGAPRDGRPGASGECALRSAMLPIACPPNNCAPFGRALLGAWRAAAQRRRAEEKLGHLRSLYEPYAQSPSRAIC